MQLKLLQLPKVRLTTTQKLLIISSVSVLVVAVSGIAFLWMNGISKSSKASVTLNSFVASLSAPSVNIQWATQDETDNAFFSLERSSNAMDYETVYEVAGNGTTSTQNFYSYSDNNPLGGVSYYRLKQTDFDGTVTYSAIQSVNNEIVQQPVNENHDPLNDVSFGVTHSVSNQNPTGTLTNNVFSNVSLFQENSSNRIGISIDANSGVNSNVSIVDVSGHVLKKLILPISEGNNSTQLDISFLPAGIYFLALTDNLGNSYAKKFVKSN